MGFAGLVVKDKSLHGSLLKTPMFGAMFRSAFILKSLKIKASGF